MQVSTGGMYEYFLPSISFFFYKDNTFVQDIIIIIIYIGRLLVQNYWIIVKEERKERNRGGNIYHWEAYPMDRRYCLPFSQEYNYIVQSEHYLTKCFL